MLNHVKYNESNEHAINNFDTTIMDITNYLKYKWYIDSSASNHVINNRNILKIIYGV